MVTETEPLYYDPYDFTIDSDPYPAWKRLRDEAPLYYNEKYDFFAVSRYDDVSRVLGEPATFISGKGTLIELIHADFELPAGTLIFDDPPIHDLHRALLSRVFRPRQIADLEPMIRALCAECLDPLVGAGGFDFIRDLGAHMPMAVIGELLGIPKADQASLRETIDDSLRLNADGQPEVSMEASASMAAVFEEYVDWRADHPSDDLITELATAEFEDETGSRRKLHRSEILQYIMMLNSAGNETTTRLIGWTGKVLAEHPDQLAAVSADRGLVGNAIEELLRYEAPSPIQARYVARDVEFHGQQVPAGSAIAAINGAANRDERHFADPDRFDVQRRIDRHISFGYGLHFCLGAALARLEGRVALDEVLQRFPQGWTVDTDHAVQARTSTVRGWELLPVVVN